MKLGNFGGQTELGMGNIRILSAVKRDSTGYVQECSTALWVRAT
jgi:hypothetical protein